MNTPDYKYIIGIDEVGRGPLAGPVVVGAFCVEAKNCKHVLTQLEGVTDSKKLTEKRRDAYTAEIKRLQSESFVEVALSGVPAAVIDTQGIMFALRSALKSSLKKLNKNPKEVFVYLDGGLFAPREYIHQETVIKGDSKIWQIGAASVVAKVTRDARMKKYGEEFPQYGFEKHKGYGTKMHREAIKEFGVIDIHRKTWIKTC